MRKLILRYLIISAALWVLFLFIPGITLNNSIIDFLKISLILFGVHLLIKPIIKIIPLPIEIATLGSVSIVFDAIVLWLIDLWLPALRITSFWFSGISVGFVVVAPFQVPMILTLILSSILLSIISTLLFWLTK